MKTPWNNCNDVRMDLPLFVGGELEPDQHDAVAEHLGVCDACEFEADALRSALGHLHALPEAPEAATLDLWPSIRSELARTGQIQVHADERAARAPVSASATSPSAAAAGSVGAGLAASPRRPRGTLLSFAGGVAAAAAVLFVVRPWSSSPGLERGPVPIVVDALGGPGLPSVGLPGGAAGRMGSSSGAQLVPAWQPARGLQRVVDAERLLPDPTRIVDPATPPPIPGSDATHTLASQRQQKIY